MVVGAKLKQSKFSKLTNYESHFFLVNNYCISILIWKFLGEIVWLLKRAFQDHVTHSNQR